MASKIGVDTPDYFFFFLFESSIEQLLEKDIVLELKSDSGQKDQVSRDLEMVTPKRRPLLRDIRIAPGRSHGEPLWWAGSLYLASCAVCL